MTKLRKFLIAGLAVCALGCSAAGIAACSDKYASLPAYRQPANYVEPGADDGNDGDDKEFDGNYTVAVMTAGGMRINDVRVNVKLNGENVLSAISMDNGEINFKLAPAEYELVVDEDTLPTGYFVGNSTYKTSATSANASVIVNSKVMEETAVSSYRYNLGDVMYDFSYTDNNGDRQVLSEILSEGSRYKAVFINFWYVGCGPCREEFPAIQSAYENYKDSIKFIAVSTSDSQSAVDKFRNENKYTFDMVQDVSGLSELFSVSATPSTVVIDRYGVFVSYDSGKQVDSRIWSSKFAHYVSDNYTQDTSSSETPGDGDSSEIEKVEPNVPEDDYGKFPHILNGNGANGKVTEYYGASNESDKQYNWPWVSDVSNDLGRDCVKTTNATYGNSYAIMTATVTLSMGDFISYDYFTDTEAGMDILYVLVNGDIVARHSGDSSLGNDPANRGWLTNRAVYTASRNRTVELSFCYMKDQADPDEFVGRDFVAISNITIENVSGATEAIDMKTDACSGEIDINDPTRYSSYVTPYFNDEDKYYHVKYEGDKDSILYLDFLDTTAWSDLHIGDTVYKPTKYNSYQPATLYYLIYWDFTNWDVKNNNGAEIPLELTIGGADKERLTEAYIVSYYLSTFSKNSLIPVTQDLKDLINAYLKEYCRINEVTFHNDMWLEFCYYFMHWGGEHTELNYDIIEDRVPVSYDEANDVYRVDSGSITDDSKVYIDFVKNSLFEIEISDKKTAYYSIEELIEKGYFNNVGGSNYTATMKAYLALAMQNERDYGLVQASKELCNIIEAFVTEHDGDSWKVFACFYKMGECNTYDDPVIGMDFVNAYPAKPGENVTDIWNLNTIDGGGMVSKFTPDKSGVYRLYSFDSQSGDDPRVIVFNSDKNEMTYFDNKTDYDMFLHDNLEDFDGYIYLEAGQTYYLRVYKGYQVAGKVYYNIEYVGDSYDHLRVATTADGLWSYDLNMGIDFSYYLAIDVTLGRDNNYYHIDNSGNRGSVVYIDFIHPNFYEEENHSLLWIIEEGYFDFTEYGGPDRTGKMREYYYKSIAKDKNDETYGMIEASKELVDMLNDLIWIYNGEKPETMFWLSFATYYEHIGA